MKRLQFLQVLKNESPETKRVLWLILLLYLPFIFLGLGTDNDTWRIITRTIPGFLNDHHYVPSRLPGYFPYELVITVLYPMGGALLCNLGSLIISLIALTYFLKICAQLRIPHPLLLGMCFSTQPYFWVNSTSTIDFLWAIALVLIGFSLWLRERWFASAIMLGLAVGTRLSSVIYLVAFFLGSIVTEPQAKRKPIFFAFCLAGLICVLLYIPSFMAMNNTFRFLSYTVGDWDWKGYASRFLYKNIYFWGLPTFLFFLWITPKLVPAWKHYFSNPLHRFLLMVSLIVLGCFELLFFKLPTKTAYLMPIVPIILLLMGIGLQNHRKVLIGFFVLQLTYNFLSLNFLRPDNYYDAKSYQLGLWLEPGVLVSDTAERLRREREGYDKLSSASFQPIFTFFARKNQSGIAP